MKKAWPKRKKAKDWTMTKAGTEPAKYPRIVWQGQLDSADPWFADVSFDDYEEFRVVAEGHAGFTIEQQVPDALGGTGWQDIDDDKYQPERAKLIGEFITGLLVNKLPPIKAGGP